MNFEEFFDESNLPKQLTNKEIIELFKEYKNGDLKARDKIIEGSIHYVLRCVNKYFPNCEIDKEELVSVGMIGLIKSVDSYDLDKTQNYNYAAYIHNGIYLQIIKYLEHRSKYNREVSVNNPLEFYGEISDSNSYLEANIIDEELLNDIKIALPNLPIREQKILEYYFGLNGNERTGLILTGEKLDITGERVRQILIRAKNLMKRELENINKEKEKDDIKEYYCKLRGILSQSEYRDFWQSISIAEAIILALYYGFYYNKKFNIYEISDFLGRDLFDTIVIIKNAIYRYKGNLDDFKYHKDEMNLN